MNWYKLLLASERWFNDDDVEQYINALIENEMEGRDLNDLERMELEDKIHQVLSTFPPGYRLRKTEKGWTVFDPQGRAVSVNEKLLEHSLPGGKARFDYMGLSV